MVTAYVEPHPGARPLPAMNIWFFFLAWGCYYTQELLDWQLRDLGIGR